MGETVGNNQVLDLSQEERLSVLAELLLEIIMEEKPEGGEDD